MADASKIQEFPDINNKLAAPTKKSFFERQKADAEAKRLREEAETAAVYEDFVKSFEDDAPALRSSGMEDKMAGRDMPGPGRGGTFGGPPKRHFAGPSAGAPSRGGIGGSRGRSAGSGPGSLGPVPSSISRKRMHDGDQMMPKDSTQGLFAFEDAPAGPVDAKAVFRELEDDNEEDSDRSKAERAIPKPTLHLSSLPPGTSPAVIKSYLPQHLEIDGVRILPPSGPGSNEHRSTTALVTLAKSTPANDIDSAVNVLQNRYLGWGHYMSISRHLSSAALNSGAPVTSGPSNMLSSMPFGARPVQITPGNNLGRGPPPHNAHRGGFAPPSSYAPTQFGRGPPMVQVSVTPPSDLKQLKLIHKTLEALLTHGPEFEALLMSRAEVQQDERWAWLWDPRSPGGVWYRWRLWEVLSNSRRYRGGMPSQQNPPSHIFEGGAAWVPPSKRLRFEYVTQLEEFISDSDYDSSEDEYGDDDDRQQHHHHHQEGPLLGDGPLSSNGPDGKAYLNPLQKSKLTHLLARLPTSNAKLRKGDIARITAFAIEHAGEGADEVVDMIISNIRRPISFTCANPDRKQYQEPETVRENEDEGDDKEATKEPEDTSAAKLIALYVVSDILSCSSTSGVRHAWRYRQLFETAFKQRKVFEALGQLEKQLQWGRLRAEKWKRSISSVLTLWEGWCVFPQASQEQFTSAFMRPPPTAAEEADNARAIAASEKADAGKSKWRTVDVTARPVDDVRPLDLGAKPVRTEQPASDSDMDGMAMDDEDDLDGEPMEDIDGEPMEDNTDGEPMTIDTDLQENGNNGPGDESRQEQHDRVEAKAETGIGNDNLVATQEASSRRRRPKAEDMFADSDDE